MAVVEADVKILRQLNKKDSFEESGFGWKVAAAVQAEPAAETEVQANS